MPDHPHFLLVCKSFLRGARWVAKFLREKMGLRRSSKKTVAIGKGPSKFRLEPRHFYRREHLSTIFVKKEGLAVPWKEKSVSYCEASAESSCLGVFFCFGVRQAGML